MGVNAPQPHHGVVLPSSGSAAAIAGPATYGGTGVGGAGMRVSGNLENGGLTDV